MSSGAAQELLGFLCSFEHLSGFGLEALGAEYPSSKKVNLFIIVGLYKPQKCQRLHTPPLSLARVESARSRLE